MAKVLLVSICKEKLHELEFVRPIADILKSGDIYFEVCHYTDLCTVDELKKFDQLMQKNVSSVGDILSAKPSEFFEKDEVLGYLKEFSHVIICGTSLVDNDFINSLGTFQWILNAPIPVLGICGGFQAIGMICGGKLTVGEEIGYYFEKFDSNFLGLEFDQEVFHLHNNFVEFSNDFDVFSTSPGGIVQAVKHKKKDLYGVLFHPEVRQRGLILEFVK